MAININELSEEELSLVEENYNKAVSCMNGISMEDYQNAVRILVGIQGYKDADIKLAQCKEIVERMTLTKSKQADYKAALRKIKLNDYKSCETGIKYLTAIGDYERAAECIEQTKVFFEYQDAWNDLGAEIDKLHAELDSLGLFKGKEKKALRAAIEEKENQRKSALETLTKAEAVVKEIKESAV